MWYRVFYVEFLFWNKILPLAWIFQLVGLLSLFSDKNRRLIPRKNVRKWQKFNEKHSKKKISLDKTLKLLASFSKVKKGWALQRQS